MTSWWQFGLTGGIVLSVATAIKLVRALFRSATEPEELGEAVGFALAIFGMGFLCGVIVWAGKGLHRRFGVAGDAFVGAVVLITFFLCCMLLFAQDFLGTKFYRGGLPMLGLATVVGIIGGVKTGYDLRKEAKIDAARKSLDKVFNRNPYRDD